MKIKSNFAHKNIVKSRLKASIVIRFVNVLFALALSLSGVLVINATVSAAELTPRSIEMSDSSASSTGVTYHVSFTTATTGNIQGIVVDFCGNDPLIGDSCTAPAGFTVSGSPTFANLAGTNPTTGWAASTLNAGRTFVLTNGAAGSVNSGTQISFDITNVTNPNTADFTFYGRILTYSTSAGATGYVAGTEGSPTDKGGIALSTGNPVVVTARVEEQLSFCVFNTVCGDNPSISLGHGPNDVLDSTAVDTNTDQFSVNTNASNGANVRLKGSVLTNGSNTIPAVSPSPGVIVAGTAAFGLYMSSLGTGMTAAAEYAGTGGDYGFNVANIGGTYGDTIATSSGVLSNSVSAVTFGATANNTTPAGIYTANEELIATGNF